MKNLIKVLVSIMVLFGVSYASDEAENEHREHHKEPPYYVSIKGIYNLGDTYKDEEGDPAYGFGIDLGFTLMHGFSIEVDGTYENSDVKRVDIADSEKVNIKYYTSSVDLVYVYEFNHHFGAIFKVGYEYEYEKTKEATNNDTGFIGALGLEYIINDRYNGVVEYEKSQIKSPKGDMVMAGVKIKF